jgi:hypothetical protein
MFASERIGVGVGRVRSLSKRLRGKPTVLPPPPGPPLTVISNAK